MDRTILHCDCNGFYASVECVHRPELKRVPMAVCGNPENRHGIILAKNELAKRFGIQTAETVWQARKKCPQLVLVQPHRGEYARYSQLVNQVYQEYTDMVEPFGIDESWLDVTGSKGLFGEGRQIADTLRRRIRKELGLTISVGVSFNKVFAKLGSDYKKPDATTEITRGNYRELLYPLPVTAMLFVGKAAAELLARSGIHTIGSLAQADRAFLVRLLGKQGEVLSDYARGLEDSPVRRVDEVREIKSVGNGMTFRRNLEGLDDIRAGVAFLADTVAARLRRHRLKCQAVQVMIRNPSFRTISRQRQLPHSTDLAKEIADAAVGVILASWNPDAPIRMLTITGMNLIDSDTGEQLSLIRCAGESERQRELETTIDRIRDKFGSSAVQLGSVFSSDLGIVPEKQDDGFADGEPGN